MISDPKPASHRLGGLRGWGQKVKIQLFQINVMLPIKLKEITNAAAWLQIFCSQTRIQLPTPPPPPDPWVGAKFIFFSEHGHVAEIDNH